MATLAMVAGGETIPVTVSVGIATAGPAELGVTGFIERADGALYQAKRAGRDRCSTAGAPVPLPGASGPQALGMPATPFRRP
jgi:PleD family two-component response regulator